MFSRTVVPFLPNHPPRWPEVVRVLKKIVRSMRQSEPASGSESGSKG